MYIVVTLKTDLGRLPSGEAFRHRGVHLHPMVREDNIRCMVRGGCECDIPQPFDGPLHLLW